MACPARSELPADKLIHLLSFYALGWRRGDIYRLLHFSLISVIMSSRPTRLCSNLVDKQMYGVYRKNEKDFQLSSKGCGEMTNEFLFIVINTRSLP